ncbi:MAG: hypothetical protein K5651_02035 [Bacteroidales bacterium]|nr:hypothetical protein [Bacteroidales bacterium]
MAFSIAILSLICACNKTFDQSYADKHSNQPVTVTQGENVNLAKTFAIKDAKTKLDENNQPVMEEGKEVKVRSMISTNADGSWVSWDQDEIEVEGTRATITSVKVLRTYNYKRGTYTVKVETTEDNGAKTVIKFTDNTNAEGFSLEITPTTITYIPVDENDNVIEGGIVELEISSEPDVTDSDEVLINGNWSVDQTEVSFRGLNVTKKGLDAFAIASWAQENFNAFEKAEDMEKLKGYNAETILITDSSVSIDFTNGESYTAIASITDGISIETFVSKPEDIENVKKYFNGNLTHTFMSNYCFLKIKGTLKTSETQNEADPIMLTLRLVRK